MIVSYPDSKPRISRPKGSRRFPLSSAGETRPARSGDLDKELVGSAGNFFETLKSDQRGQYSIRTNDQWRICFEWPNGLPGPQNVEIVHYQ